MATPTYAEVVEILQSATPEDNPYSAMPAHIGEAWLRLVKGLLDFVGDFADHDPIGYTSAFDEVQGLFGLLPLPEPDPEALVAKLEIVL